MRLLHFSDIHIGMENSLAMGIIDRFNLLLDDKNKEIIFEEI